MDTHSHSAPSPSRLSDGRQPARPSHTSTAACCCCCCSFAPAPSCRPSTRSRRRRRRHRRCTSCLRQRHRTPRHRLVQCALESTGGAAGSVGQQRPGQRRRLAPLAEAAATPNPATIGSSRRAWVADADPRASRRRICCSCGGGGRRFSRPAWGPRPGAEMCWQLGGRSQSPRSRRHG